MPAKIETRLSNEDRRRLQERIIDAAMKGQCPAFTDELREILTGASRAETPSERRLIMDSVELKRKTISDFVVCYTDTTLIKFCISSMEILKHDY